MTAIPFKGQIYETKNYGKCEVIEYKGWRDVLVRFIDTGYEIVTGNTQLRDGNIKDIMMPSIYGVGYFGKGAHKANISGKVTKSYDVWMSMLARCYSDKYQADKPTYIGCSVAKDWHDYQVFADWFALNYVEGFHMDKDILLKGNRIYGPNTCKFVSPAANTVEAHARHYTFFSPEGKKIEIYNLAEFCRENGLGNSHMQSVYKGKRNHHRQWRKYNG
tara:strand:+ start:397 stop:1050 length:654 start_codon:yes stop_codon:yes gene_type:complete